MKSLMALLVFVAFGFCSAQQEQLSAEDAKNIFSNLYGGVVHEAQTLTVNTDETFILADWSPYESQSPQLRLLLSFAGSFVEVWAKDDLYQLGDMGLSDLNEDGYAEVYWKTDVFGNTVGDVSFFLYDISSNQELSATLHYTHGYQSNDISLDDGFFDDLTFLNFIQAEIAADEHFASADTSAPNPDDPENADTIWRAKYGSFSDHASDQVTVEPKYYALTEESIVNHSTKIEFSHLGLRFVSVFKNSVYAVDDASDRYFMVFSPKTTYDWVTDISPLGPCVALTTNSFDYDVAYYNVTSQQLSWSPEVACRH